MVLRRLRPQADPGGGRPVTPDWEEMRQDYSRGSSIGALARKWGIPESTLRKRAKREGWKRDGQETKTGPVQKDEQQALRLYRVDSLADGMLTCLERAVAELDAVTRTVREKVKKEDGTDVITDYDQVIPGERGLIDRGGLKQLTGVLKDLKEVLSLCSEGESLEREMRIQRLQRELSSQEAQILVRLEGGSEQYAD